MHAHARSVRFARGLVLAGLAAGSAALAGCGQDPVAPDSLSWVFGQWVWHQSSGGIAGHILTPDSVGYTEFLTLESGGDLYLWRDSTVVAHTTFHVTHGDEGDFLHTDELVFTVKDLRIRGPFFPALDSQDAAIPAAVAASPTDDTLMLVEQCADCCAHTFGRVVADAYLLH